MTFVVSIDSGTMPTVVDGTGVKVAVLADKRFERSTTKNEHSQTEQYCQRNSDTVLFEQSKTKRKNYELFAKNSNMSRMPRVP